MMRYTRSHGYNNVMRSHRYRPILIIALVLVAAFLLFKLAGVGGINEGNFEAQRSSKLRSEMQHAVSSVNSLSRQGGSSSSGTLSRIRQYVHGMEVINDLNVGMYGEVGRLYEQSVFTQIYDIIDRYEACLSTGQNVNSTLMELSSAIEALSNRTYALLDYTAATPAEE